MGDLFAWQELFRPVTSNLLLSLLIYYILNQYYLLYQSFSRGHGKPLYEQDMLYIKLFIISSIF